MRYARWNGGEYDQAAAQRLREAGYPALLAAVLAARGVSAPEETAPFLEREERLTWSPLLMRDMDRAVERIGRALADGERCSATTMWTASPPPCWWWTTSAPGGRTA